MAPCCDAGAGPSTLWCYEGSVNYAVAGRRARAHHRRVKQTQAHAWTTT